MKVISWFFIVLFFWIIYPYKWANLAIFNIRKANAIRKAETMTAETGKQVYVVQYKTTFITGLRSDFRRRDSKIRRKIDGFLDWDYRNAIIHKTL